MTAIVNSLPTTPSGIQVSFTWTPASTYTFTAPNGLQLIAARAAHGTVLTFTAATTIYNQDNDLSPPLSIIEYHWDFGDGIIAYGNPATHTYVLANFQAATKLRITDSKGRHWWARAQMYLS